jgi:predicted RNase H-like nuclease
VTSILAIDPAWTADEPSGIALLHDVGHDWRCVGVAPSYEQFIALADGAPVDWSVSVSGGRAAAELLGAAKKLLDGLPVDLVTIDMPMSTSIISSRRAADNAISQTFGGRGCGTHTPSATRPGPISDVLRAEFAGLGYRLATTIPCEPTPALIEVYPHPALLVLMRASYRVPYKVSKAGRYWPTVPPSERRRKLAVTWGEILRALSNTIAGIDLPLPTPEAAGALPTSVLKRYEDALDALVCGWVGVQYLDGLCTAYGDDTAAIWTP